MPSRAEIRGTIELALRAVSITLLAWIFWLSLDRGRPESTVSARTANLATSLREWSRRGITPDNVVAQLDSTPTPTERDWLADLSGAGSNVLWSGDLPAVAIGAQPIASPRGGLKILAASPNGRRVEIADEVGTLDTAQSSKGGAVFTIASASGELTARAGATKATTSIPDSALVKRVLVIGRAGWEAKFVIAALEEDGWKVDADMRVAPGVNITQGSLTNLDTARYSAVITLDNSAAARASEIARFAAEGGGVILAGSSAGDAFSSLRPGEPGKIENLAASAEPGTISLASLSYAPIVGLKSDAIALERRGSAVIAAARRFGAGRVVQLGLLDTWRWRMSGGDTAPEEHRAWWTQTVAAVAYATMSQASSSATDNAPVSDLVAALGPASSATHQNLATATTPISLWLLFALLSMSLLAEWASRRLRGVR
jgi:hypothetical protein